MFRMLMAILLLYIVWWLIQSFVGPVSQSWVDSVMQSFAWMRP